MKLGAQLPFVVLQTGEVPVLFRSIPGHGKSSLMLEFAKQMGRKFYPLYLNARDREDIKGYPVRDPEKDVIRLVHDTSLHGIERNSIVFLDEISTAPNHMLVLAQRILSERYLGEKPLEDAWLCGAFNPPGQSPDAKALRPAIVNRCAIFDWQLPAQMWKEYILLGETNSRPFIKLSHKAYEEKWGEWAAKIAVFLSDIRPDLHTEDPRTEPYCSPRSSTLAIKAAAAADAAGGDEDDVFTAIAACVGDRTANAIRSWLGQEKIPAAADILEGKVDLAEIGPVIRHVAICSLPSYVFAHPETLDANLTKMIDILDKILKKAPEAVMLALRSSVRIIRERSLKFPKLPPKLLEIVQEYLQ